MSPSSPQQALFDVPADAVDRLSTTFSRSMGQSVHRWFRYSAGFSATWAEETIAKRMAELGSKQITVLDPFVGSGTTLLAAEAEGARSMGVESHPFVARVARAKLQWRSSPDQFATRVEQILESAEPMEADGPVPPLLPKCFTPEALAWLRGLRVAADRLADGSPADELAWIAFVSIIRAASHVGTAQWQYVLPNKSKARVLAPTDALASLASLMVQDMRQLQSRLPPPESVLYEEDARSCDSVPDDSVDMVVTSPPYANNYDYADATRLEMTVLGEVSGWADLKPIRNRLVRSCSQHMVGYDIEEALANTDLAPIYDELVPVVARLTAEKSAHGGKKAYDAMIVAYFSDLARVWFALRAKCVLGSSVCFVVGDSAPYGVYVPVDEWLAELALAAGFKSPRFEKTRDRNIKWKNRKHRVPLKEGRLWVDG